MKTKHTPGPWFAVDFAGSICIQDGPTYEDRDLLCYDSMFNDNEPLNKEEVDSNAKQMKAAPKMFEALTFYFEMIKSPIQNGVRRSQSRIFERLAKEAIKEATE